MANIKYPAETTHGKLTAELITLLVAAKKLADQIRAKQISIVGAGATTLLEVASDPDHFAYPAGTGDAVYNAFGVLKGHLDNVTDAELADFDQGG